MSRFNRGCGCDRDRDRVGGAFDRFDRHDRHDRDVGGAFDRDRFDRCDRVGGVFDRDRDCDFVGGRSRRKPCICFLVEPITDTLRCIFCGCGRDRHCD